MSGPDVCEHGNPGDRPCAQCVAAAPVAPEPSPKVKAIEYHPNGAIKRVEFNTLPSSLSGVTEP